MNSPKKKANEFDTNIDKPLLGEETSLRAKEHDVTTAEIETSHSTDKNKKYSIPVNGILIEVSEDVYRAFYRPIWRTCYHARKNDECRCTKGQSRKCEGDCFLCKFHTANKKVDSLDAPTGKDGDGPALVNTLVSDAPSVESIIMDKELLDALYDELDRLEPDDRRICELFMEGKTEREIAANVGKTQSTINYQKHKVFSILREALKDFI